MLSSLLNFDYLMFQSNLSENGELAESKDLKRLWRWLHLSSNLSDEGLVPSNNTRHPGVRYNSFYTLGLCLQKIEH